uniref:Glycosyl hydrolase family 38 C-terminal domain-containing protein n=1 Tax=Parascaris univalens TaxID=6257 RepID=A0A915AT92_PARUN
MLISGPYFQLGNEFLEAKFDAETGLLQSVTPSEGTEVIVNISYVEYGVRGKNPGRFEGGDDLSGAYLFLPDGPARPLLPRSGNPYVVLEGILLKKDRRRQNWNTRRLYIRMLLSFSCRTTSTFERRITLSLLCASSLLSKATIHSSPISMDTR